MMCQDTAAGAAEALAVPNAIKAWSESIPTWPPEDDGDLAEAVAAQTDLLAVVEIEEAWWPRRLARLHLDALVGLLTHHSPITAATPTTRPIGPP